MLTSRHHRMELDPTRAAMTYQLQAIGMCLGYLKKWTAILRNDQNRCLTSWPIPTWVLLDVWIFLGVVTFWLPPFIHNTGDMVEIRTGQHHGPWDLTNKTWKTQVPQRCSEGGQSSARTALLNPCTWLITDHHLAWWSSLGIPQFWTKPHAVGPHFFHPTIFHHLPIRLGFRLGFLDFCPYDAMFLSVKSPFFLVEIWGNPPCLACLVKTLVPLVRCPCAPCAPWFPWAPVPATCVTCAGALSIATILTSHAVRKKQLVKWLEMVENNHPASNH